MNRISVCILVILIVLVSIYVPGWLNEQTNQRVNNEDDAWQPNYQANRMQSTLYNSAGVVTHKVNAKRMEHYALLGFTLFEMPEYTIYIKGQENPWKVTAKEGTLYEDNKVEFEKEVLISSLDKNGYIQTISTEFLQINLDSKTMQSDSPVTIDGFTFTIDSVGFSGNLVTRTYELIEHVQTQFNARP